MEPTTTFFPHYYPNRWECRVRRHPRLPCPMELERNKIWSIYPEDERVPVNHIHPGDITESNLLHKENKEKNKYKKMAVG